MDKNIIYVAIDSSSDVNVKIDDTDITNLFSIPGKEQNNDKYSLMEIFDLIKDGYEKVDVEVEDNDTLYTLYPYTLDNNQKAVNQVVIKANNNSLLYRAYKSTLENKVNYINNKEESSTKSRFEEIKGKLKEILKKPEVKGAVITTGIIIAGAVTLAAGVHHISTNMDLKKLNYYNNQKTSFSISVESDYSNNDFKTISK